MLSGNMMYVDEAELMQADTLQIVTYIRLIRANNVMLSPW